MEGGLCGVSKSKDLIKLCEVRNYEPDKITSTEYTVSYCFDKPKYHGQMSAEKVSDKVHGVSDKFESTLCGINISNKPQDWMTLTNNWDGKITCKECLKKFNVEKEIEKMRRSGLKVGGK